jgi:glycosyltransferase involved in cell wall biosynthesis
MARRPARVLIIVQNLPVPLDRRVWMECQALVAAGYGVSVICPKGPGDRRRQTLDGVSLWKYPPPPPARGLAGYLLEFGYCWIVTAVLSVCVSVRDGFGAIQACNPPDTYFLLGRLWKVFGKKFVYDQHDLNPEVWTSRFGDPTSWSGRLQYRGLLALERGTYRTADHVISTNESYKSIALTRGLRPAERVTVVRSGPDTDVMRPVHPRPDLRHGFTYMAVYLGIMGPQDGVDTTLRALRLLIDEHGRTDCGLALLGFGDCLDDLKALCRDLDLDKFVTFTGRANPDMIADYLSTADLGLCPDPSSPLNDVSTMNKTMEYMAYCLPVLTFDLKETRVSAEAAASYVAPGDLAGFAAGWNDLLDDGALRVRLGAAGRARVSRDLDWRAQAEKYVGIWRGLTPSALNPVPAPARSPAAGNYVDLDHGLADFIRDRGRG